MDLLLKKIGDSRLARIVGSINPLNAETFDEVSRDFPEYDSTFLWIICYQHEGNDRIAEYINANHEKYHHFLDSGFLRKLASKGNFDARMWEMVLCDTLSASGTLIEKDESGADFLLRTPDGDIVQVEAVTPNEADDATLRSVRPTFDENNMSELSGNIEDLERPVLLRFLKGFDEKEKRYGDQRPLFIAINTSKVVGFVSLDEYILRRVLFGLGYVTVSRHGSTGLQQNPLLNKPDRSPFNVARFRDDKYKHVSGVIYTSQKPHALIPGGGHGWHNQGVTFVPNPNALHRASIEFPFFKKMLCTDALYQEVDAEREFESSVSL